MNNIVIPCFACGKKNRIPASKQHLMPKCGHCGAVIHILDQAVPVELDDLSFHEFVKKSSLPVMVDFFSPTCGPCRTMMPVMDKLAKNRLGTFIVAKLDTSRNPGIANFFSVQGVPSFLFFKEGQLVDQLSGAVPENVLIQKMESVF